MAHLFIIENGVAKPTPEILLVSPFKDIWERDKTTGKGKAIKEFSYIEFMSSKKASNPFKGYEEEARDLAVRREVFADNTKWKPDAQVKRGIRWIEKVQTEGSFSYRFHQGALIAAEKLLTFFYNFDLEDKTDKGFPLYKPKEISSAIADTETILTKLKNLEIKVEEDLYSTTKTKGNKEINIFEQ